jgi:hypothetical protein
MGAFDLPAPLFAWLDDQASMLPPVVRLIGWGLLAGWLSMGLYRLLSPQQRIRRGKAEIERARQALDAYDGDLAGGWPLIRRLLRLALRQVGRVGGPGLVASLPLLSLLGWLVPAYGYAYPEPGVSPAIHTRPPHPYMEWVDGRHAGSPGTAPRVVIADHLRRVVADVTLHEPIPVIHERHWWNMLFGNPLGYLPPDRGLERIRIELPRKSYLPFVPSWLRGWEVCFFVPLLASSLALKAWARIA